MAAGGARADVLTSQAMAALEAVPAPELVIIQTMDNDLDCDGEVEANVKAFGAQVAEALGAITEASPESKILIVSQRGRPATYTAMMADISGAYLQLAGSGRCALFNFDGTISEDGVATLTSVIESYEAEQMRVCAEVPQCATDEGTFASYVDDVKDYADDFNHLNVEGNAQAAAMIWPVVEKLLGL